MDKVLSRNLNNLKVAYNSLNIVFTKTENFLIATGNTYNHKHILKEIGFGWNSSKKKWEIPIEILQEGEITIPNIGPFQSIEKTRKEILLYMKSLSSDFLKLLLEDLLINGEYKNSFFISPASKTNHHAYDGGLMEHTLQVIKGSLATMEIYPYININRDILIAGAILHDIGKNKCYYSTSDGIQGTNNLYNFDHIILGISIVSCAADRLIDTEIDRNYFEHLLQIITSHHNLQEWGSPKPPRSVEAWIIHTNDQISSKIGGNSKKNDPL
jgi:putative nucleotidyltransferase with HDIG domain